MINLPKILDEISQLKSYFPFLISRVELRFIADIPDSDITPYFTHVEERLYILQDYLVSKSDREIKFLIILHLLVNYDLSNTSITKILNSLEIINYYKTLISLDADLMNHIDIPSEYDISLEYMYFTNPIALGAIEDEEFSNLYLFATEFIQCKKLNVWSLTSSFVDIKSNLVNLESEVISKDDLNLFWRQLNHKPMLYYIMEYYNILMVTTLTRIKGRNKWGVKNGMRGWDQRNYIYTLELHYHPVLNSTAIELFSILISKKNRIEGKMVFNLVCNDEVDYCSIEIRSTIETPLIKFETYQIDSLLIKVVNNISDIKRYPNQYVILASNLDIVYTLNSINLI